MKNSKEAVRVTGPPASDSLAHSSREISAVRWQHQGHTWEALLLEECSRIAFPKNANPRLKLPLGEARSEESEGASEHHPWESRCQKGLTLLLTPHHRLSWMLSFISGEIKNNSASNAIVKEREIPNIIWGHYTEVKGWRASLPLWIHANNAWRAWELLTLLESGWFSVPVGRPIFLSPASSFLSCFLVLSCDPQR